MTTRGGGGRLVLLLTFALTSSACTPQAPETDAPETGGPETLDLLFHNGHVLTLDDADTVGSSLAVRDGRIVEVGDASLPERYRAAEQVDLAGRTLMPGFVDSHIHIRGNPRRYVELTDARSVADIQRRVRAKAEELGAGQWITGYGWSEDLLEEQRRPLMGDLDAAAPNNPVVLTRAGGHSAVASSHAFRLAGIDADTPDPERGVLERTAAGELNGIIRERQDLLLALVPEASAEELRPSHVANLQALLALGITSIVQASDSIHHYPEWEAIYAEHGDRLPRASVQLAYEGRRAMAAFGKVSGDGDERLRVGAIKLFADGGFTGPAAFTREPYRGRGDYRGKLNMPPEALHRLIRDVHTDGWQLGIHAIGDAAIEIAVEGLDAALAGHPRDDHRHYLNHFTLMPGAPTLATMAADGIAITQQPNFTYTLEGRYVEYLDGDRLETNNPLRTPMDHGIHLALSSDVLPIGPLVGLYAAVTRRGMSGRVFGAEERLTMLEALKGYTRQGAWLTREEDLKGTLEAGKLADLIVLSGNPLETRAEDILGLRVLATYLGGRQVYHATD